MGKGQTYKMKTSYLYQIVNLLASIILIAVLLRYLTNEAFLQWSLFTTIGGLFIQCESALSTVCIRYLVSIHYEKTEYSYLSAVNKCKKWYKMFSMIVFLCLLIGGLIYFNYVQINGLSHHFIIDWVVFCVSFLVTFNYAYNCCILISREKYFTYSIINVFSRIINVSCTCILLVYGLGVTGLCISFIISSIIGSLGMKLSGNGIIIPEFREVKYEYESSNHKYKLDIYHVLWNCSFTFVSYSLFRVGLLIDVGHKLNHSTQASYSLGLQIQTLILALATVPISMLVSPLQRAVIDANPNRICYEMSRLAVYANSVFIIALTIIIIIGPILDYMLNAKTALPHSFDLLILGFAFLIELNIKILANVAMASLRYEFTIMYIISAFIGLLLAILLWSEGTNIYIAFGLIPALIQMTVAYPLIYRSVRKVTGISVKGYFLATIIFLLRIIKHPISIGLSFK